MSNVVRAFGGWSIVVIIAFAVACSNGDDEYTRRSPIATGDPDADAIISAMLERDAETIFDYWNALGLTPCVPPDEIGRPKCIGQEAPGTHVREGATACGRDSVRLEDLDVGVAPHWDVYSVELLSESRGRLYRAVFSERAEPDERALVIEFRAPGDKLRGIVPTAFISYAESCDTAGAATADATSFVIPPLTD